MKLAVTLVVALLADRSLSNLMCSLCAFQNNFSVGLCEMQACTIFEKFKSMEFLGAARPKSFDVYFITLRLAKR